MNDNTTESEREKSYADALEEHIVNTNFSANTICKADVEHLEELIADAFYKGSQWATNVANAPEKQQSHKSELMRLLYNPKELLHGYYNYLMDEFNGNASEEAIILYLDSISSFTEDFIAILEGYTEYKIKPESDLKNDLGLDSLDTVELVVDLEKTFNIMLAFDDIDVSRDITVLKLFNIVSGRVV